MKKIAIIGSGISGTSSAYYLNKLGYDVTVFEGSDYFGGHTNTIDIDIDNKTIPVDTGFLVHNDRTYPNLIDFFNELEIETYASEMTFSVKRIDDDIAWAGTNLLTLFAQPKNLFNLKFWAFLKEILHFNKMSHDYLKECSDNLNITLGDLLESKGYSENFKNWYLLPMGGCIWSTPTKQMLDFPAYTFLVFCHNHGLLQVFNRPQWKTLKNGCRTYVKKALSNIKKKYLNEKVVSVYKVDEGVKVKTTNNEELFDYCIFSCHAPQALEPILNPDPRIKDVLSAFKYQPNKAVLHLDEQVLPKEKSAWAAWNYLSGKNDQGDDAVSVTYLINNLQPVPTLKAIMVTLNPIFEINENLIFKEIEYEHPIFDSAAVLAQAKIDDIQGIDGMFFCGAWQRYGFHEDGILSAKKMLNHILRIDNKDTLEIL